MDFLQKRIVSVLCLSMFFLGSIHAEDKEPPVHHEEEESSFFIPFDVKIFPSIAHKTLQNLSTKVVNSITFARKQLDWIYDVQHYFEDCAFRLANRSLWTCLGYNPEPSRLATVGKKEASDGIRVTFINGILNAHFNAYKAAKMISEAHGNVKVYYLYTASQGFTGDVMKGIMYRVGVVSPQATLLTETWKKLIQEMGGVNSDGEIIHYAHSLGAVDSYMAMNLLTEDERKKIHMITFGSPSLDSPRDQVKHFVSTNDGVPVLDGINYFSARLRGRDDVVFLPSSSTIPLTDHPLSVPSYSRKVEDLGKKFQEKYIEKKQPSKQPTHAAFHQRDHQKDLPKIFQKSLHLQDLKLKNLKLKDKSKSYSKDTYKKFREYLLGKEYKKLGSLLKETLGKELSLEQVKKSAKKYESTPLFNAVRALENIQKLDKNLGLKSGELLEISLFLETEWKKLVQKGYVYLQEKESGLPRILEYDPKTRNSYIHLLKNGIPKIGKGFHKEVTKSILYDSQNPEIVANCRSDSHPKNLREMKITRALQGIHGIVEGKSFIRHRAEIHGKDRIEMILNLYNVGSLRTLAFSRKGLLNFKEKMQAARDLAMGLEGMHSRDYVHRDLHSGNYLFHLQIDPKSGKRFVKAAIMDFGKTIPKKQCGGNLAQGSKHYTSPEGFIYENMVADDYLPAEIYALGCSFFLLHYEKEPDWFESDFFAISLIKVSEMEKQEIKKRYIKIIKDEIGEKKRKLAKKHLSKKSPKYRFENLIFSMMDPDPLKRPTAADVRKSMDSIVHAFPHEKSQD